MKGGGGVGWKGRTWHFAISRNILACSELWVLNNVMGRYPSAISMHMSVDKGVIKGDRMRVHKGMHLEEHESVRRCAWGHTKGGVEGCRRGCTRRYACV